MFTLLKQVKIIDPASEKHQEVVDILFENNAIVAIDTAITHDTATVIKTPGCMIMPGWVDTFADFSEPGYEYKETLLSGLNAAANGGFKHVMVVPNTLPVIQNKSMIDFLVNRSAGAETKLYPIGAISKDIEGKDLAEMLDMHHAGAIAFSDGWQPIQQAQLVLKALEYVKAFDGIVIQIPINNSLSAGGLMHEGFNSVRLGMPGIPSLAESLQVYRELELLRYTQSRLHLTGISTKESVDLIRDAKAEGLKISCAVTPYHLMYTDDVLASYDSHFKVAPPIRSEEDRQALITGVLDGTIDCIASHHQSHEWDAKAKEFEYASHGMNTIETAYSMVLKAIPDISPELLNRLFSANARQIFNINGNGIAIGSTDYTIVKPQQTWTYNDATRKSMCTNSPLYLQELIGKATCTTM